MDRGSLGAVGFGQAFGTAVRVACDNFSGWTVAEGQKSGKVPCLELKFRYRIKAWHLGLQNGILTEFWLVFSTYALYILVG